MKKMNSFLRLFLVFVNSWLLAFQPTAMALSSADKLQVKNFVETSGLAKGPQSFADFYQKIAPNLPPEISQEFKALIQANPKLKLPKMNVSKVLGENGEEDIQLQFMDGKQSYSILIKARDSVFAQIGDVKISKEDLRDPKTFAEKIKRAIPIPASRMSEFYSASNYGVLDAKDLEKLTATEKKIYFKKLREILVLLEKRDQQQLSGAESRSERKTSQLFIDLIMQEAQAANAWNNKVIGSVKLGETTCIYGGYVADYGYKVEDGKKYVEKRDKKEGHYACGGPESKFWGKRESSWSCKMSSGSGIKCNPAIFGSSDKLCVAEHNNSATENCANLSNKWDVFPTAAQFKYEDEFNKLKADIVAKLQKEKALCDDILGVGKSSRLEDQQKTCESLKTRIDEIEAITCSMAEGSVSSDVPEAKAAGKRIFAGSKCSPRDPASPVSVQPVPPVVVAPPVVAVCKSKAFVPADADRSSCAAGGTIKEEAETKCWFCDCAKGFQSVPNSSGVITGCRANGRIAAPSVTGQTGSSHTSSSSGSSFFSTLGSFMPYLATAGVLIFGGIYLSRANNPWIPGPTATPQPSTTATPNTRGTR